MPNATTKTTLRNFRFPDSTTSRLKRIVKERRSKEPDKHKKSAICMTSVLIDLVAKEPVNWKA